MNLLKVSMLAFILIGCATNYVVDKPGVDQAQFRKDNYECSRESGTYGGGSGLVGVVFMVNAQQQADMIYKECMEIRGYTVKTEYEQKYNQSPPAGNPAGPRK